MGFIEDLNKYAYKTNLSETKIYKAMLAYKSQLEKLGLSFKMKNEYDLYNYEIIYHGLLNQNLIDQSYELFVAENYDMLYYLGYEEKRLMFNNDLNQILKDSKYIIYNDKRIYIPYLEEFLNQRYHEDYQVFSLKQHKEYLNQIKINDDTPRILYGNHIYQSPFSSLTKVYEDERHICLYYDDLKKMNIYKKENYELLNYLYLVDHKYDQALDINDVKKIADYIESYQYKECLNFMFEKQYISSKTFKKINKKYK